MTDLVPGQRFGSYDVLALIGEGGMGRVYRARDLRLRREVALKVLPGVIGDDPGRVARFEREATILASLNHPNIAVIHGVEEADGVRALVLELVDGPTLADRIAAGPLPLPDILTIATAIVDALESAHESGVIHRDLKPANIKVRRDGNVKVLDFGLAKALLSDSSANAGTDEPTMSQFATRAGTLLGTAAYMSPEQARGDAVDRRTDIWAFGCVLYEMLAHRRAFGGDRAADTVASVLREAPDWQRLPSGTPEPIRRLLRRCLEKDPRARLRDIGDARIELRDAAGQSEAAHARDGRRAEQPLRRPARWVGAVLVASVASGAAVWSVMRDAGRAPGAVVRLSMTLPAALQAGNPTVAFSSSVAIALSPDGTRLVYVSTSPAGDSTQLSLRLLSEFEPRRLDGTDGATAPFFSPDGQSVAFFAEGKLKRITLANQSVATICDAPEDSGGSSGAWGPDNEIVFAVAGARRAGLFRVSAEGGSPEVLTTPDPAEEGGHGDPSFVPGARAVLFGTRQTKAGVPASIQVVSLEAAKPRKVIDAAGRPLPTTSGHLLVASGSVVSAVPFDAGTLQATGTLVNVLEGVRSPHLAVSTGGRVVYVVAASPGGRLVWVDRRGAVQPVPNDGRLVGRPRLSPDSRRAVMEVFRDGRSDIGVYQFDNQTTTLLTSDGDGGNSPYWHPDGRRVVFRSGGSLYWQSADGTTPREQFLDAADPALKGASQLAPGVFTPDGSTHVFVVHGSAGTAADIWSLRMGPERRVVPIVQRRGNQWGVRVSPDGRWISYASDETGRFEIYLEPIAGGGVKHLVSNGGGWQAVWSPSGREIFYRSDNRMMTVPFTGRPDSPTGIPYELFTGRFLSSDLPYYAVTADGQRFLMVSPVLDPIEDRTIRVVDNWTEELKQRVPTR